MTDLETPIKDVTVYTDRALVTRSGAIHLDAGEHELRVKGLPKFLRDSLRAAGQGPQGTRILNVDVTTAFYSRPPEEELVAIQDELDQLLQNQQLLLARQSALNDRRQWLRTLGEQSRDFAKGLAKGQMKPQDCADFFSFAANQALQDAEAAQALETELKQIQLDINAKQRQLAQQQGGKHPDRLAAIIIVELKEAGDFRLELSYLVMGASWHPQYDVRVQMNDVNDEKNDRKSDGKNGDNNAGEVELTYVGVVQQSTGERWENVGLSLSTARPSQAAILPELAPWYINLYTPPPAPMRTPMVAYSASAPRAAGAMMPQQPGSFQAQSLSWSADGQMEAPPPEVSPVDIATATVEQTGTALLFRVGRSVDIPSDNSPHKTSIARDTLPCTFDYVSAPVIEEYVHLRATIHNSTERVLLEGDASIFLSNEYVGTTKVKKTAPTEKFKIFLGIDDGIKVKRELIERDVNKGGILQNGIRRTTYAYRIKVHNYAAASRNVVIRDHLPVSQHEKIKIKVQSIQPPPTERTRLEVIKWKFTLAPDAEQQIEYHFAVEQPQDVKVTGI